jgi:hypothetical protein
MPNSSLICTKNFLDKLGGLHVRLKYKKRVADLINTRDSNGRAILHNFLFERGAEKALELIQFFVSKGADFSVLDKNGNNPGLALCKFMLEAANKSRAMTALEAFTLINLIQ